MVYTVYFTIFLFFWDQKQPCLIVIDYFFSLSKRGEISRATVLNQDTPYENAKHSVLQMFHTSQMLLNKVNILCLLHRHSTYVSIIGWVIVYAALGIHHMYQ